MNENNIRLSERCLQCSRFVGDECVYGRPAWCLTRDYGFYSKVDMNEGFVCGGCLGSTNLVLDLDSVSMIHCACCDRNLLFKEKLGPARVDDYYQLDVRSQ